MGKLVWDEEGSRTYETGVKNAALYLLNTTTNEYDNGVVWNGITSVSESPSGAESTPLYADDIKYLNLVSAEDFGATVEAYTYPDEFAKCDGSDVIDADLAGIMIGQQTRSKFGLAYTTTFGNDTESNDYGKKIHLIYGCSASPSEKSYATINDSPEAITFSWEITTTAVNVPGKKPTANVIIDSTKTNKTVLAAVEAILFGCDVTFDSSVSYKKGDIVEYENALYIFKADQTASTWTTDNVAQLGTTGAGPRLPKPDELVAIAKTALANQPAQA